MQIRPDLGNAKCLAFPDLWQSMLVIIAVGVVAPFLIDLEKAIKGDHRAASAQRVTTIARYDDDGGLVDLGTRHLTCEGAFPNELVELVLIVAQFALHLGRQTAEVSRADGLVCFLCVLGLTTIMAWFIGQVACTVFAFDGGACAV